jgi:peptidyl-prolyl cis-trans isomerase D
LAEIDPGKKFVVFEVGRITPSAAAPIEEIRPQVMADLMIEKGLAAAKAAAQKMQAAAAKGTPLPAAQGALGMAGLPPVQTIDIDREQFASQRNGVPPPLALLFSMAQGTTKLLADPGKRGWFVVSLAKITPGDAQKIQPLLEPAGRELSQVTGREYAEELRRAMRDEVGTARNEVAIKAVARQLTGGN